MKEKNNSMLKLIMNRRSIRSFLNKPIPQSLVIKIIKAGQRAPSSGNFQLYSVIQITKKKLRKNIANVLDVQKFVETAPVWLIICVDWARLERLVTNKGIKPRTNIISRLLIGTIDASLFTQNAILACESLGLGSILIGSPWCDMCKLAKLLKLPRKVLPIMLMCIGYPTFTPPLKPRWHVNSILHQDHYSSPSIKQIKKYYENNNEKLIKMKYFEPGIKSWKEHWRMRLTSEANKRTWSKIPEAIHDLHF